MDNKWNLIFTTILVILSIGLSSCTNMPGNATVNITNFSFQPDSIDITAGSTVVWTNDDSAPHTITADDGTFDSGRMTRGSEFQYTFSQPGTFGYHCSIHPSMTGKITVREAVAKSF